MSVAWTITITHPSNGAVRKITPAGGVSIPPTGDNPRTASFRLSDHYDIFSNPADTSNPLTWASYVVIARGSQNLFEGMVVNIDDSLPGDGPRTLRVDCLCISGFLQKTFAHYGDSLNYERTPPSAALTGIPLVMLSGADGFADEVLYPVFPAYSTMTNSPDSTSPWVARSKSRTTTLGENITDVRTTPFKIGDDRAVMAPCFFQIGTEIIHVSQVYKNAAGESYAGGTIKRGCLGSTAAAHSSGDTIYQRVLKPITDAAPIKLTYDSGKVIPEADYNERLSEGRFDFYTDFSAAGYDHSSNCSYTVEDIDNASGISLASLATDWLEAAVDPGGGPGISAGDIDTTGFDEVLLGRQLVDEASGDVSTWGRIWQLIDENWQRGSGTSRKALFYRSAINGKYILTSVKQQGTAAVTFKHAVEKISTYSLSQLYQGVRVSYDTQRPFSLLDYTRMYHLAVGDNNNALTSGSVLASQVSAIMYQQSERSQAKGWVPDTTVSNDLWTNYLLDGNPQTGWGMKFNEIYWTSGDDPTIILCAWFPGASVFDLSYVRLRFDARSFIPTFMTIEVVGLSSYTPGSPPTLGSIVGLGIHYRVGALYGDMGGTGRPQRHFVLDAPR